MAPSEVAATTIDALLASARHQLDRLSPEAALAATRQGAALIDIRSEGQQRHDGFIPGATVIARNVLEWRLDPSCAYRNPGLATAGNRVIILCDEGYQSSLAAATLKRFGLEATDVVGGFQAWRAAGMPVERA
jgi:rhodanese-related sulfurtransferase